MLTAHQIDAILAAPGSYSYLCVYGPTGDPFFAHTAMGHVLHVVSAADRKHQAQRAGDMP